MKHFSKLLSILLLVSVLVGLVACGETSPPTPDPNPGPTPNPTPDPTPEHVDFVGDLKLDMNSSSAKQKVTIKAFIDGDTTHFHVPTSVVSTGVLKARYLAVNTPESTGKIEEWGKVASNFTKEKLSSATEILLESDDGNWNWDSTGSRYLVWVWYKPAGESEYRNLNLELLQNGLAIASNSGQNRYGEICLKAIAQAKREKLYIYSGEKDPGFYYGGAQELTLKELLSNISQYENTTVAFNAVVTQNYNNGVYVEAYDEETNKYYGMYIYYGFNLSGTGVEILTKVGNECRIVGSVQYYATGGTWQVTDIKYREAKPSDPNNVQLVSQDNPASYIETDIDLFLDGTVEVSYTTTNEDGEEVELTKTVSYAEMSFGTTISMKNLKVVSVYTTDNEESSSNGAMSLTCEVDGKTITVRTTVFRDADGSLMTEEDYLGKTINVRGIVDYFNGDYQIKVFVPADIEIIG